MRLMTGGKKIRCGRAKELPWQSRELRPLSNDADVKAVSEMLGHADIGITLRIYHHVNVKSIRQMHWEYSPLREFSAIGA